MRAATSYLFKAIGGLQDLAQKGTLPSSCRWILDSRLIFLKKKSGKTPRPIRIGELWRRVIAKRLVNDTRTHVRQLCFKFRQFGVAFPGGAEILIHFRKMVEELGIDAESPLAVLDLDLANAFPSFEWTAIRDAAAEFAPELLPWTS